MRLQLILISFCITSLALTAFDYHNTCEETLDLYKNEIADLQLRIIHQNQVYINQRHEIRNLKQEIRDCEAYSQFIKIH